MSSSFNAVASFVIATVATVALGDAFAQSSEVNVYTYRESKLIQPLFDAFTKDTGIKVNVISASSGLEQRIKHGGRPIVPPTSCSRSTLDGWRTR